MCEKQAEGLILTSNNRIGRTRNRVPCARSTLSFIITDNVYTGSVAEAKTNRKSYECLCLLVS